MIEFIAILDSRLEYMTHQAFCAVFQDHVQQWGVHEDKWVQAAVCATVRLT